ncbi:MAG TPA: hemerythrin domain-containing protein [Pirellulales bacterium]|nr:hemerythrin domain-containing protein [Pirellulales bacterium]
MIEDEYLAFVAAFQTEHRELQQLVQALKRPFGADRPWSRELASEAARVIDKLEIHLRQHFAQEEEGGYLEQALAVAPRFHDDAESLLRQHGSMLQQIDQVVAAAKGALVDENLWRRLQVQVKELLRNLIAHETAENQIVQQALNTGIEAD